MTELGITQVSAGEREVRESYTDQQVTAAVAAASGAAPSALTAAVEAIARLWEAAFASARSEVLEPWQLAIIGRCLVLRGESVWWRSRASGLLPVADHDVYGSTAFPGRWSYRVTLPAPGDSITRNADADRVLHARIGCAHRRPWRGCSPLENAGATRATLERIERSLSEEHDGPNGHVIGVSDPSAQTETANEIGTLKGRTILTEATEMDLPGEGQQGRSQWKPNRIGPAPAASTITGREAVERSLLAAAGVPTELVLPSSAGEGREAWRRFLFGTIAPAASRGRVGAAAPGARVRSELRGAARVGPGRPGAGVRAAPEGRATRARVPPHLRILT